MESSCKDEAALRTDDRLSFVGITKWDTWEKLLDDDGLVDIIFFEIANQRDVERLKVLRSKESAALLVLLTTPQVSPTLYLKPKIAPDMLLLRPIISDSLHSSIKELFEELFERMEDNSAPQDFILKDRGSIERFPFSKISYFEARNKKIVLRIGNEEHDFYDSIDNIAGLAPSYFVRCHRAFLVNTKKIKRICMAEKSIELQSGSVVPLSRTYRHIVAGFVE